MIKYYYQLIRLVMTKEDNMTTYAPPSEKQVAFLKSLLGTREVDEAVKSDLLEQIELDVLEKRIASEAIDSLLKLPKLPKSTTPSPFQELLRSIPKSRYAIPVDELELTDATDSFTGDLVFVELKEYMQTLYMRQLHGAPGGFSRSKLAIESVKAIIAIIATDPYKYTRIFGEHYTCCGSCGAELTDTKSRELMLGPECRKKFGR
jgi:hypothetical protein